MINRRLASRLFRTGWTFGAAFLSFTLSAGAQTASPTMMRFEKDVKPLLAKYCYECHGDGLAKGQVSLDEFTTEAKLLNHDLWLRALKNLRAGMMPPKGEARPTAEEMKTLETWIKRDAFGLDSANPDPGRVTLRRLNRTEYKNTIRELMGIDFKVEEEFPPDDTGYGFDNIGDVLSISSMLLEKYMQAAETIVAQAVPSVSHIVPEKTINGAAYVRSGNPAGGGGRGGGGGANADRISLYRQGTFAQNVKIDQPGEYRVVVQTSVHGSFDFDPAKAKMTFKDGEEELFHDEYVWQDGKRYNYESVRKWEPGDHQLSFEMQPLVERGETQTTGQNGAARNLNVEMRIISVKVQGPLDEARWIAPPNYTRFFTREDAPADEVGRREYAKEILEKFTTRAFRRPADDRAINRLVSIAESFYKQPGKRFENGIQQAMIAVLSSPRFIFRVEDSVPAEKSHAIGLVDEYALASRLSYFLWSTMPDEELFALAQGGKLRENLPAQIKRMLVDSRSSSLSENFTGQWLQARDVDTATINGKLVAARDAGTEAQLRAEEEAARANRGRGRRGAAAQQQQNQNQAATPAAAAQAQQTPPNAAAVEQLAAPAPAVQAPQQTPPAVVVDQAAPTPAVVTDQAAATPATTPTPPAANQAATPTPAAADQPAAANAAPAAPAPPVAANTPPAAGARRGGGRRGGAAAPAAPELDRDLRIAMRRESEMYFGYIMNEDRSVLEFIDSNYTFLNEKLAKHYGVPDVTGTEMRRVELPADNVRGGVLTQGTMLVVTSNPTRTSPVKRGLFILENILGTPPPPPPADVPQLEAAEKDITKPDHEPSMRELMQSHRDKPLCSACHLRMDPLGFGFENFNALGMWRTKERGQEIDSKGQLVTGEEFSTVKELKQILKDKRQDDFYRCLTEKFMTYALGRGMDYYDTQPIDEIVEKLKQDNGRFTTLLNGVINSTPFQKRRNSPTPVATVPGAQTVVLQDEVSR